MSSEPKAPVERRPWVTIGLIALCSILFTASWALASDSFATWSQGLWMLQDVAVLERLGGLVTPLVWHRGQWWRVLSAGFLHGSLLHCGLNMMALWAVGSWLEKAWGGWRLGLVFLASSVGACLASLAFAEAELVVGASGGIFGLAGALVVARTWGSDAVRKGLAPVSARRLAMILAFWLAVGFALPSLGAGGLLAQAGHVGGLVIGVVLGIGVSRRDSWRIVGLLGALVGLGVLGWGAGHPGWRANYYEFTGYWHLREGRTSEAAEALEEALARRGDDPELSNAVAYGYAEAGEELARGLELVEASLKVEPDNPDYLDTRGWILCKLGDSDGGERDLRAALVGRPGDRVLESHLQDCPMVGPR